MSLTSDEAGLLRHSLNSFVDTPSPMALCCLYRKHLLKRDIAVVTREKFRHGQLFAKASNIIFDFDYLAFPRGSEL